MPPFPREAGGCRGLPPAPGARSRSTGVRLRGKFRRRSGPCFHQASGNGRPGCAAGNQTRRPRPGRGSPAADTPAPRSPPRSTSRPAPRAPASASAPPEPAGRAPGPALAVGSPAASPGLRPPPALPLSPKPTEKHNFL